MSERTRGRGLVPFLGALALVTAGCGNEVPAPSFGPGSGEKAAFTVKGVIEEGFDRKPVMESLLVYGDTSRSDLHSLLAQENEIAERIRRFLLLAPRGATAELHFTGSVAGYPRCAVSAVVPRAHRPEREAYADRVAGAVRAQFAALKRRPPNVAASSLIEDFRLLSVRGARLPGARAHLVAYTDAEFYSRRFTPGPIFEGKEEELFQRVTKRLPKMECPPASFTLVYLQPREDGNGRLGDEGPRLSQFLRRVVIAWGVPAEATRVIEPLQLTAIR